MKIRIRRDFFLFIIFCVLIVVLVVCYIWWNVDNKNLQYSDRSLYIKPIDTMIILDQGLTVCKENSLKIEIQKYIDTNTDERIAEMQKKLDFMQSVVDNCSLGSQDECVLTSEQLEESKMNIPRYIQAIQNAKKNMIRMPQALESYNKNFCKKL